jgi:hypothetical protein
MQCVIDDFAIERPKAAAVADLWQHDNGPGKLGESVTRKRPFGRLANQLDQDQADDKAGRGSDDLLDRIEPDLMVNAGTLADIEIERARDHIADGCGEQSRSRGAERQ